MNCHLNKLIYAKLTEFVATIKIIYFIHKTRSVYVSNNISTKNFECKSCPKNTKRAF